MNNTAARTIIAREIVAHIRTMFLTLTNRAYLPRYALPKITRRRTMRSKHGTCTVAKPVQ